MKIALLGYGKEGQAAEKYFKTKNPKRLDGFDYEFHQRLADELPRKFWY